MQEKEIATAKAQDFVLQKKFSLLTDIKQERKENKEQLQEINSLWRDRLITEKGNEKGLNLENKEEVQDEAIQILEEEEDEEHNAPQPVRGGVQGEHWEMEKEKCFHDVVQKEIAKEEERDGVTDVVNMKEDSEMDFGKHSAIKLKVKAKSRVKAYLAAGCSFVVRSPDSTISYLNDACGILSPCLFNLYAEFIMRKAGLDESQAGIKIAGRNINNLRYADDTTLMAESEEELKNLLMRVKEESAKYGLKLNIKKTKIMATGPITSWQIEGEEMEAVRDFTFLGSLITADGDSSHEIKRRLLLGRKAMTNLDSILKSRDITLPTKVRIVKAMVFPVVMYGSESWTIKKADRRRIDAFELWCWRRLLRVPWTARRSNLSILQEISPECSLEGQIMKLRLQYFGHLMRREESLEKTLMLGKIEGTRRRGRCATGKVNREYGIESKPLRFLSAMLLLKAQESSGGQGENVYTL
ncbi:uncharacterized protein LOC132591996 [Zootoca vivipara]|uniref:uncharacterized protein LOC132591996 n=1 Tax=Zootoca vivipara TaxID=8524 RepID=UPI00293BA298|nr:uncharacterized protein LOC132591996 [Zootoca vivipara]